MTWLQAAALGAVQGLTEFLPVSSSAHLALAPRALGFADPGLTFDVALHLGTLAALLAVYGRTWLRLLGEAVAAPSGPGGRRLLALVLATAPAAMAGLAFENEAEELFRDPRRIAWALIGFGLLMEAASRLGAQRRRWEDAGWGGPLLVGAAQALAIVPGVSRSGATVSAALLLGMTRESAAELSFLLSAPIIAGAAAVKLRHLGAADLTGPFLCGIAVSAATGLAAVKLFLGLFSRLGLRPFVLYRLALGTAILLAWR